MADKGKRLRPEGEGEDDENKQISRKELTDLFENFKDAIAGITKAQVERASKSIGDQVGSSMQRLIVKYDEGMQKKLGRLDRSIEDLKARAESLEESHQEIFKKCADLSQQIDGKVQSLHGRAGNLQKSNDDLVNKCEGLSRQYEHLAKTLEVAESAPTQVTLQDPGWERDIDGTIIRISAREPVPRAEVIKSLEGLLDEYKDKVIFSGTNDADNKQYTIKFTGPTGVAKDRVGKVLGRQRQHDGTWQEFYAKVRPLSGAALSDDNIRTIRLSISDDKSPRQVAREIAGKKLREILKDMLPGKRLYFARETGKISCNWVGVARVDPKPDRTVNIEWNVHSPLYSDINKDDAVARFRLVNGTTPIHEEWAI